MLLLLLLLLYEPYALGVLSEPGSVILFWRNRDKEQLRRHLLNSRRFELGWMLFVFGVMLRPQIPYQVLLSEG